MTTENTNKAVAATTKQNEVTKQLLMDFLKQTNSNLLPNEMAQFVAIATTFNLNPWKREIYPIAYGDGNRRKLSIIVGYEVYLRRAEEFPQYDGYETTFFGEGANMGCSCKVFRKDRNHAIGSTVFLREYNQGNQMWNTKPHVMLEKVAIATAMRRAFPSEFNGMPYTADELPDKMTGGEKLREQGFVEVHADVPDGTVAEDTNYGEIPNEKQATDAPAETASDKPTKSAPVQLDDKKKSDFYTMLSAQTNRLGTKIVNEVLERNGGVDVIVGDKDIAKAVAIELKKIPGKDEQEVLF